jgi:hypothetical protein
MSKPTSSEQKARSERRVLTDDELDAIFGGSVSQAFKTIREALHYAG